MELGLRSYSGLRLSVHELAVTAKRKSVCMAPLMWCRFFVLGDTMSDILQKAAKAYQQVCNHKYRYTLSNGKQVYIVFKPQNFVHLAGLRKLSDLYEFHKHNTATNIYKNILRGKITCYDLQRSIHFNIDAKERIENLCRLDHLLRTKQVVWNFDRAKTQVRTKLKSNVLFFRDDGFDFYLMLGVVDEGQTYYPETFFLRYDAAYIQGQQIVSVKKMELI